MADTENKEVARITFVFETICSVNCELYFMVVRFLCLLWGFQGLLGGLAPLPYRGINITDTLAYSDFTEEGPDCLSGTAPFNMGLTPCDGPQDGSGMGILSPPATQPSCLLQLSVLGSGYEF